MEAGERPEEALVREIREELDAEIRVGRLLDTVEWDYPDFHLTMHCFLCTPASGEMQLKEHEAARWLGYEQLGEVRWLPADEGLLPLLAAELLGTDPALARYLEGRVIPQYAAFDAAHREDHARAVVARTLDLAQYYPVDRNILYAAAACHDLGLAVDRKTHHLESGKIIRGDAALRALLGEEGLQRAAEAAEDHRASGGEPRTVYGRIVAEADRLIDPETVIRRTIQFGLDHYPELDPEGHWERTLEHLREKYGDGGYLKLWVPESPNAERLEALRRIIRNESELRNIFDRIFPILLQK